MKKYGNHRAGLPKKGQHLVDWASILLQQREQQEDYYCILHISDAHVSTRLQVHLKGCFKKGSIFMALTVIPSNFELYFFG